MQELQTDSFDYHHDLKGRKITSTVKGFKDAQLSYELDKPASGTNKMVIKDVYVPDELQQIGIADALALQAVKHADKEGYLIKAACPFMQGYMNKHPEFKHLLTK